jgi:hypothetical protein|tara:strand:- start:211 stop:1410 length:1200 start_codon:yes stop_codon:yes gene_type:complete
MKILIYSVLFLTLLVSIFIFPKALRVHKVKTLYDKDKIVYNFLNMDKIFPTREIKASKNPKPLKRNIKTLPETFFFEGEEKNLQEYLDYFWSDGMIVLHKNEMVYENYWLGNNENKRHISWSVAKSFISALVGIAYEEGLIDSLDDPVTKYLDDFKETGYDGVTIKDILQMSSGVLFNEDYADYDSDINRFGRAVATGTSMRDFSKTLTREREPGTYMHYVSINTQVLGFLLQEVTNKSISQYLYNKIWNPLGMEDSAYFILDDVKDEFALGGLNATLRDYAKFGLLYLQNGRWNDNQIISKQWIEDSHSTDGIHLVPGERETSSNPWGYGYQWWVPGFPDTDYTASGVYNQYIYIDPLSEIVIAKTSSNFKYTSELQMSKDMHMAMFRAIANHISSID